MALTLISNQTLSSNQSTITFNSITGYTHLMITGQFNLSSSSTAYLRCNGDSTSGNYMYRAIVGSVNQGTTGEVNTTTADSVPMVGFKVATLNNANFEAYLLDYSSTTKYKNYLVASGNPNGNIDMIFGGGAWKNNNAITSITIHTGTNFVTGSNFSLYGLA